MATLKTPVSAEDHIQGDINAPIILVEYGDYECPYCGMAYPIVKRVQEHFGKKLCLVFRNFPLNESHPHAELAAETAEFAASKGHFWEMHDGLYENQESFSEDFMLVLIKKFGMKSEELKTALENRTFINKVKNDFMSGVKSGVNGTPTFYINGARHENTFEYEVLVKAIEDKLSE